MRRIKLEVCVDSVESAVEAERGGADRIELCANLDAGGITPSAGLIQEICKRFKIGVHVMVRPRAGDFCYSREEFETMKRDVEFCKRAKVGGVVFGILTLNRKLDVARTRLLAALANPLHVTMHCAIDEIENWIPAVNTLMKIRVQMILTSGGKPSVMQGLDRICLMAEYAGRAIEVVPGAGITFRNVRQIAAISRIRSVHVLSCVTEKDTASSGKLFNSSIRRVSRNKVKQLAGLLLNQ